MAYSHDGSPKAGVKRAVAGGVSPGTLFGSQDGVDFIKVPSIVKAAAEVWRPLKLRIRQEKMRERLVAASGGGR
jgi:hypothetical protein